MLPTPDDCGAVVFNRNAVLTVIDDAAASHRPRRFGRSDRVRSCPSA
jgi:hypothetical protein